MFWGFLIFFLKIWFSAQKSGSRLRCRTMLKNTLKHPKNTNKTCFEAFWEILENPVRGWKMWFSAQISNYAKIPWNTQKTPTKHVLRLFKKFSKIRFSAQKSGSPPRCRAMLKYFETLRKHQLNTLWGILRIFLKIRFSAQMSNNAKIPWNAQKTTTKHVLRLFKKFLKIRFSAEKSGSRLRFRTMLKYLETLRKHQLNMFWGFLRIFWKSASRLKHPVLGSDVKQC